MTRTITHSEFTAGSGEPVYVSTVHYASRAEREAGDAACRHVVAAAAFQPLPKPGEPFDAPEFGVGYAGTEAYRAEQAAKNAESKAALDALAAQAQELGLYDNPGEYRAGLQFESAAGDLNPQACVVGVCGTE
jgi:hypothetical protein